MGWNPQHLPVRVCGGRASEMQEGGHCTQAGPGPLTLLSTVADSRFRDLVLPRHPPLASGSLPLGFCLPLYVLGSSL